MPKLPPALHEAIDRLPQPGLFRRAETRYGAIIARRAARAQAEEAAARAAARTERLQSQAFSFAAKDPSRSFQLASGVHLSLEDRWFIAGMTGTGKTTLARELMNVLRRLYPMAGVYILDSKSDDFFNRDAGLWEGDDPPGLLEAGGQVVWRPESDDIDAYSAWFEDILHARRPAIVYVDELSSLSKGPNSHCPGYAKLLKQGRSLHQCVITLSQEAAGIQRQVRNQVHHLVRMRLLDEIDAQRLDRLLQGATRPRREPTRPHGLWYGRLDRQGEPREFPDWKALLS